MSLDDTTNRIHDTLEAWRQRIETHFDQAIERVRQLGALLIEAIVGLVRLFVTVGIQLARLAAWIGMLLSIVLPFAVLIAMGVGFGGSLGAWLIGIAVVVPLGIVAIMVWTARGKTTKRVISADKKLNRSELVVALTIVNLVMLAIYGYFWTTRFSNAP